MHFDYLIVATDLSDCSASAARWAHGVKQIFGSKVVVVHVVEVSVSNWFSNAYESFENETLRAHAETNLANWYSDVTGQEPDAVEIRLGSPSAQLQELHDALAPRDGALLVLSMSGKGRMEKFFLGSTARVVAATPPCPLVVVHPEHEYMHKAKPIVVGTDFSTEADGALRCATRFADEYASPLVIVHGNPTPPVMIFDGGDIPIGLLEESALQWSQKEMSGLLARHPELESIDHESVVVSDAPSRALADCAKNLDADLLIVGHSGESKLAQTVLGSVAQRVLNEMPCTLIIVP